MDQTELIIDLAAIHAAVGNLRTAADELHSLSRATDRFARAAQMLAVAAQTSREGADLIEMQCARYESVDLSFSSRLIRSELQ